MIELPTPFTFSETSRVLGMSKTVAINQTYSVSNDLSMITISLKLPFSGRRLQSTAKINAGDEFIFTLTQVKNAYST